MSDPLAALYPSAKAVTAEPAESGASASDTAAKLYDNTPPSNPPAAKPPAPSTQQTARPATEAPMAAKPEASPPSGPSAAADLLFNDDPPTEDHVDWNEAGAATAAELGLDWTPHNGNGPVSAEVQAERDGFEAACIAAGAGPTFAKEVMASAAAASKESYQPATQDAAMTELQALWGDRTGEKVNSARELIQKAAAVNPAIIDYLERTGLGNDPKFIRQMAARAAAQTRQAREKAQVRRQGQG